MTGDTEMLYRILTSYGFAGRYAGEGPVLDIVGLSTDGDIPGTRMLCEHAGEVTALFDAEVTRSPVPKRGLPPNASLEEGSLPYLPYPDGVFDTVLAFEVLERLREPQILLQELHRVLGEDGTLLLSSQDRQGYSDIHDLDEPEPRRELHVPDLRKTLEERFPSVRVFRQKTVAGGVVFDEKEWGDVIAAGSIEPSSLRRDAPGARLVVATRGGPATPEPEAVQPYLFLDDESLLVEEHASHGEEVRLLRLEIEQMQHTEVRTFWEAVESERSRSSDLWKRVQWQRNRTEELERQNKNLADRARGLESERDALEERLREMESSRLWRLLTLYRRIRNRLPTGGGRD